jgi:diguanylate cyclase (GGDEF)-like protein/PAS domain S-box-containing protein
MESQNNRMLTRAIRRYAVSIASILICCAAMVLINVRDASSKQQSSLVTQLHGDLGVVLARTNQVIEAYQFNQTPSKKQEMLPRFVAIRSDLESLELRYEKYAKENFSSADISSRVLLNSILDQTRNRIRSLNKVINLIESKEEKTLFRMDLRSVGQANLELMEDSAKFMRESMEKRNDVAKFVQVSIGTFTFGLVLSALFQIFLIIRPMMHTINQREAENRANSLIIETALQDVSARSAELQEQQAILTENLQEQQIVVENYKMASIRLQKLLASIPMPCIGVDVNGLIYEWNESAQKLFGYTHMELFETSLDGKIFDTQDALAFKQALTNAVEQDTEIKVELPASSRDGHRVMIEWSLMPMRGMNGEVSSVLITGVDITERLLKQKHLAELAYKDALTGLSNRRAFLDTLANMYNDVSEEHPLSVVLMDVDKFKVFNDTYGHPAGDALLRRIGELWRDICPENYLPGRYGGEEFICLLPGVANADACVFADEMRKNIEAYTLDLHGATASFGVSTTISEDLGSQELIELADKALYHSKHNGRNQVTSAFDVPAETDAA